MKIQDTAQLDVIIKFFSTHSELEPLLSQAKTLHLREHSEVLEAKTSYAATYGINQCEINHDKMGNIRFILVNGFDGRQELLAFCKTYGVELPLKVQKMPSVHANIVTTRIMYTIQVADDLSMLLYYDRPGLPSKACRIVTSLETTVACDIGGNLENNVIDENAPF